MANIFSKRFEVIVYSDLCTILSVSNYIWSSIDTCTCIQMGTRQCWNKNGRRRTRIIILRQK